MSKGKGVSKISKSDLWIVKNMGKLSPAELEAQTGLSAEEVYVRGREILGRATRLSVQERISQLLFELEDLSSFLDDEIRSAEPRFVAGIVNAKRQIIDTVLKQLRLTLKENQGEADAERSRYALLLSEIVGRSFERTLGELKRLYPGVSTGEVEEMFRVNLRGVAAEYEDEF